MLSLPDPPLFKIFRYNANALSRTCKKFSLKFKKFKLGLADTFTDMQIFKSNCAELIGKLVRTPEYISTMAIRHSNIEIIKKFVTRRVMVKSLCFQNNSEIIIYMLEKFKDEFGGYDINSLNEEIYMRNNTEMIEYLKRNNLYSADSALCGACWYGDMNIIKNIEYDRSWNNMLFYACHGGIDVIKYVIERGANDLGGALMDAAGLHELEICKYLVELGADNFNEALYETGRYNKCDRRVIDFLVKCGANNFNETMDLACYRNNYPVVKIMLELGADNFNEVLATACERGYCDMAELMIECGANNINECYAATAECRELLEKYGAKN